MKNRVPSRGSIVFVIWKRKTLVAIARNQIVILDDLNNLITIIRIGRNAGTNLIIEDTMPTVLKNLINDPAAILRPPFSVTFAIPLDVPRTDALRRSAL